MCVSLLVPDVINVLPGTNVTALELTNESTEPDPGITFGCKQIPATHCVFYFFALFYSCAISFNLITVLSAHL